jgi:hypothetical protein
MIRKDVKKRSKYPRSYDTQSRDQIIDFIQKDLYKKIKQYHIMLLKNGISYTEVEDCIINDIFNSIASCYSIKAYTNGDYKRNEQRKNKTI